MGLDGAKLSQELFSKRDRKKSGREQLDRKRRSGFPGHEAEAAHLVVWRLRRRGYSHSVAQLAGHLVSPGGDWNFQGNRRLASWIGRSERTVRRARAVLEADGWIRSHLLLPGDKVAGQRAAVVRPHVVRDVGRLQQLARIKGFRPATPSRDKRPGERAGPAPRSPSAAETTPATADELAELARERPQFAAFFQGMAAAKQRAAKATAGENESHRRSEAPSEPHPSDAVSERESSSRGPPS